TLRPSGEKRGWPSNGIPLVSAVAVPPAIGTVYRSPSRSKTMVRPSGDTSSEIHVPSSVSRLIDRVGTSSRSGFRAAAVRRVVSCWAAAGAAYVNRPPASARSVRGRSMERGPLGEWDGGDDDVAYARNRREHI